jgi:hypothetical protein
MALIRALVVYSFLIGLTIVKAIKVTVEQRGRVKVGAGVSSSNSSELEGILYYLFACSSIRLL